MAQPAILNDSTYDPEKEEWHHNPCGTMLMGKRVSHPIHDSGIPLAGSGEVYTETVPYCPKCDKEPSPHGAPLDSDPRDADEAAILQRMRRG